MMNNQDEQDPNGPNEEPAHNENGEEEHVDAPACPVGSPCIRVIEGLRARIRRLQEQQRQHRTASTFALSRREAACDKKDSEIKKLKGCLEIQESKAEAKLDAARARAEARRQKEVGQAQASYVKLQLESSKQIETLKSSSKIQASELRHALSQLKTCQLAHSKVVAQKNAAEGKLAVLSDQHQLLKSEVADKGKVLKQLLQRHDAVQKKLNRQNELKVQASVRKEELKVRQKEVELQRVESLKRKAIEVKEAEGEVKKQVHAHRAKCMKAIARNRAFLKGEEHRRNVGTSKDRINQASAFQNAAAVAASQQGGTFPSVGGGPDSLANHHYPPVWVQQTLTQMPSSASSTSTRPPTGPVRQQPASSAQQVVASPPIRVPGGYVRTRDTITGMDVYIHEGTGKVVASVLECYKEPPAPQQTQSSMHPTETPTQIASVSPETVLSTPPQRPRKLRKMNQSNRHNPIDLCCSDSGVSSGEEESPEIVYGKSEAQQHDKQLRLGQDPEDKDDERDERDEESDSEKTEW